MGEGKSEMELKFHAWSSAGSNDFFLHMRPVKFNLDLARSRLPRRRPFPVPSDLVHGQDPQKWFFCTMWRDQCYHVFSHSAITEVYFKV